MHAGHQVLQAKSHIRIIPLPATVFRRSNNLIIPSPRRLQWRFPINGGCKKKKKKPWVTKPPVWKRLKMPELGRGRQRNVPLKAGVPLELGDDGEFH